MKAKSALLVGASGLVGKELLQYLLNSKEYDRVLVFVRRQLNLTHPKLEEKKIDFEDLSKYKDSFKVDDVFCCLGTTIKRAKTKEAFKKVDVDYPLEVAKLAKEMQAEKFIIISSMGANPSSLVFYSRMKGLVEQKLEEIGFKTLYILRPSLLLGNRAEVRAGESVAAFFSKGLAFVFRGPLKKYRPIEAKVVALGMYKVAQGNQDGVHVLLSDEISEVTGRKE